MWVVWGEEAEWKIRPDLGKSARAHALFSLMGQSLEIFSSFFFSSFIALLSGLFSSSSSQFRAKTASTVLTCDDLLASTLQESSQSPSNSRPLQPLGHEWKLSKTRRLSLSSRNSASMNRRSFAEVRQTDRLSHFEKCDHVQKSMALSLSPMKKGKGTEGHKPWTETVASTASSHKGLQ